MDDTAVRQARRQVAWLMVPVAVIAVLVAILVAFVFWGFTQPSAWGI